MTPPPATLAQISPRAAAAYLRVHGWHLAREGELGDRWQFRDTEFARTVALPHPDLEESDRVLMFATALEVVEEVEQRPSALIVRDLWDADSDVVRFRVAAPELADGHIPLVAAPEMLQGAKDALSSAGRSEMQRRAFYGGGQLPSPVKSFVDRARVAPAERGSVVLKIRSPVDPSAVAPQGSLVPEQDRPPSEVPFERRTLWRLIYGVRAAKTAVHRDLATLQSSDALDEDIEAGLNANLCDALTHLAGDESELDAQVTVAVRWSLYVPSDEPETSIALARGELDALGEVAASLRAIQPLHDITVRGYVRSLDRQPGQQDGWVRIIADVEDRSAVVRLHLEELDYRTAIRAHDANRELEFTGTLEKAGTMWEATAPQAVRLLDQ